MQAQRRRLGGSGCPHTPHQKLKACKRLKAAGVGEAVSASCNVGQDPLSSSCSMPSSKWLLESTSKASRSRAEPRAVLRVYRRRRWASGSQAAKATRAQERRRRRRRRRRLWASLRIFLAQFCPGARSSRRPPGVGGADPGSPRNQRRAPISPFPRLSSARGHRLSTSGSRLGLGARSERKATQVVASSTEAAGVGGWRTIHSTCLGCHRTSNLPALLDFDKFRRKAPLGAPGSHPHLLQAHLSASARRDS